MSLRKLGKVFENNRELGLGLRGTSLAESKKTRLRGHTLRPSKGASYVWQVPWQMEGSLDFARKLHTTLVTAAEFAAREGGRNLLDWRNWKTSKDWPAVLILGKSFRFRGGYGSAQSSAYGEQARNLPGGFPKQPHLPIYKKDILATVKPTKKEMLEAEERARKKQKQYNGFDLALENEFKKIMVGKLARVIARLYRKELGSPKVHRLYLAEGRLRLKQ